ncbi:activator of Hsp90 ATPase 1 family protein [Natrialba chahannaoensis JCM 10990]|uniref:Activator of Hsp90 ATPase 1 family protein n=1 Tax=Natrialba chahannaoensis JCM 10990 TaxID=1227492 RepID=M0AGX3_9EURY|nr:SRPBCC domain-containing protein [Natrialba chahannaoensis]ELY97606.1 activator of Hsp90 ATPase 1 family protein [Natrialba chahannaoensis JCM 10990]
MTDETTAESESEFDPSDYDTTIHRTFDAPRDRVFAAWTEPDQLEQWWGPTGFTVPNCEVDLRPGGTFRIDMEAPDGTVYPDEGVYRAIDEPSRLEYTSMAFHDEDGEPQLEVDTVVTFEERGGDETELVVEASVVRATPEIAEHIDGMAEGYDQSFEKLDALLADEPVDDRAVHG